MTKDTRKVHKDEPKAAKGKKKRMASPDKANTVKHGLKIDVIQYIKKNPGQLTARSCAMTRFTPLCLIP